MTTSTFARANGRSAAPEIALIDYGMGNIHSATKALEHLGCRVRLISTPAEIAESYAVILPGVGAFGDAMRGLAERDLIAPIREHSAVGRPLLGICLGMQLLFESSEEDPGVEGLGLMKGTVRRFQFDALKVPHMGWNRLETRTDLRLVSNLGPEPYVYFVHSFHVVPDEPAVIAATADYGGQFVAVVERGLLGGCQFHPEKSQATGLQILRNFAEVAQPR